MSFFHFPEVPRLRLAAVGLLIPFAVSAAVVGHNTPAESVTAARIKATLPPEQQSAWLSYLERSERRMALDRAWVAEDLRQSHRPALLITAEGRAGDTFSNRHIAAWYASEPALKLADNIVSFQTPNGGWSKNLNYRHARAPGESFNANNLSRYLAADDYDIPQWKDWNYFSTLDNNATSREMRFLLKVDTALTAGAAGPRSEPNRSADRRYRASYISGLRYLLAAQYPNGGFPQVWPLEGGYHDAITINDDAATQAIEVLQDAGLRTFVPRELRDQCVAAAARGLQCLLDCQIRANGKLTVWCQQHDALTLRPVSARNFEPPAACSDESANVLLFLMDQRRPSPAVTAAVQAGVAWLRKTAVYGYAYRRGEHGREFVRAAGAGPIWSRYYEVGTDRPVFGDRDKTIHDQVSELSAERQNGYNWWPSGPKEVLDRYAHKM